MKKLLTIICAICAFSHINAQQLLMEGGYRVIGTISGQTAVFNGTKWVPANVTISSNAPLTGSGTPASPLSLANGTAVGQALVWNGTNWVAEAQSTLAIADQTSIEGTGQVSDELKLAGISTAPIRSFPFSDGTGGIQWTTMQVAPSIAGNGINTPLSIAQQGATAGQVLSWNGTAWIPATQSAADGSETKVNAGSGISVTGTGTTGSPYVVSNTAPDQTVSISGAGISAVTGTYPNFTVTSTEVDGSLLNEGLVGVAAGTPTTAELTTNTATGNPVVFNVAGSLTISETPATNGGAITITGATKREESFTATASQTTFTASISFAAPSGTSMPLEVRRNGVRLYYTSGAPTVTQFSYSGSSVTLSACDVNDIVTINYIQ